MKFTICPRCASWGRYRKAITRRSKTHISTEYEYRCRYCSYVEAETPSKATSEIIVGREN